MGAMKAFLLESPDRDDEAHSADTREIKLPAALVAKLMEAQEQAEVEAEVAKRTERRRRRENLTTLSRENPFIHPSPLAPWVTVETPFPANDERETLPAPPLEELLAKRTMKMPKVKRPSTPRPMLEVVVVVWTLMAAVALLAQQLAH